MNKELQKLFNKYCKHKDKHDIVAGFLDWRWNSCSDCILRKMPYGETGRDVCFAIWHDRETALKSR